MNSSVIGTIELADQPIESLAPQSAATLPARIRQAYSQNAAHADLAIVTDEVIEADLQELRVELRREVAEIMRLAEVLGSRA